MNVNKIEVSLLERVVVNFATIFDTGYHHFTNRFSNDNFSNQGFSERFNQIWNGKIEKYKKMKYIKNKRGFIPERIKRDSKKKPCAYVRFVMANYFYRFFD